MKRLYNGFMMSIGMFTAIPTSGKIWDDAAANLVMPLFPFAGLISGALLYVFSLLTGFLNIPPMLNNAALTLFPFFVTGLIHLDGFADTADAILSRKSLEEKRRILKDPYTGAFGVITLIILFMLTFSAMYSVASENGIYLLVFVPVMSRCVVAFSMLVIKPISENGFAAYFRKNSKLRHMISLVVTALVCSIAAYFIFGMTAVIVLGAVIVSAILVLLYICLQLKGISGDLCGCALVLSELCGILTVAMIAR